MSIGLDLRHAARAGRLTGPTGSLAAGLMQANLALIPSAMADEFEAFLQVNPGAFPLLARGRAGDPYLPELGEDIDLRSDLPRYRVFEDGFAAGDLLDIRDVWRDDLVPFAIGCSLSFESDLVAGGVDLRCHAPGVTCSAFDSSLPLVSVGRFGGRMVVSMRAIRSDQIELAGAITRDHPAAHGAPVHVGDPATIGVDLTQPIDGIGLTDILQDEVAVFWACGVSLERGIVHAAPDLAVTHAPGHMLITDLPAAGMKHVLLGA